MTGTDRCGPALGQDHTDRLIRAWIAWDRSPSSPGTVKERLNAMAAAGLPALATQIQIARNRSLGMSIPDAVQAAINDSQEIA